MRRKRVREEQIAELVAAGNKLKTYVEQQLAEVERQDAVALGKPSTLAEVMRVAIRDFDLAATRGSGPARRFVEGEATGWKGTITSSYQPIGKVLVHQTRPQPKPSATQQATAAGITRTQK